jgi:hypothetical protein
MDSIFWHFERAAEGRRDQIRISHFERDFGEFGDLFAHDSNGAVQTNLRDGLHLLLCSLCPTQPATAQHPQHSAGPQPAGSRAAEGH